jgi:transmembrane sensor
VTAWTPARRALLAAATVAAFLLGLGLVLWQPDSDSPQLYSTSVGPAEEFILEDGSSIVLNTASEISVRYTERSRDVTLLRGEARFTVARNSDRPFQVHAGTTLVRAIGTAFTIRLQPRTRGASVSTEVLVTDGTVEIVRTTDRRLLSLTAGRSAKIDAGRVTVTSVQPAEIDNQLAWIQGLIVFNGDPLSDVVSEFNRYNTRQLRIDDPAIAAMRISGTFVATDVGSFLTALEGLNIRAKRVAVTSDSPIVLGRGTDPATKVTP